MRYAKPIGGTGLAYTTLIVRIRQSACDAHGRFHLARVAARAQPPLGADGHFFREVLGAAEVLTR